MPEMIEAATPAAAMPSSTIEPASQPAAEPAIDPVVDPAKYADREQYAAALLEQKLGAIAAPGAQGEEPVEPDASTEAEVGRDVPADDAFDGPQDAGQDSPSAEEAAEAFEMEPAEAVTPESLTQIAKDNPEFAAYLENDPKLKGQIYKTAREAAELGPYRELFADIEAARSAQENSATWNDMRDTFQGSATREGTIQTLARMAELSYERGADGNVLMDGGQPVIGEDFYGFIDNIVALDLENRLAEVSARLEGNAYSSEEARQADERMEEAYKLALEDGGKPGSSSAKAEAPDALRERERELERREQALAERERSGQLTRRASFETGLQQEAGKRIGDAIRSILSQVEKQGGVISPYLQGILPQAIGAKLVEKIQSNPGLEAQMRELQRLPIGDQSRQRRLAAIDRAIQQFLPAVAREELRAAGVEVKAAADRKRATIRAQAEATRRTEPKGATSPGLPGGRRTAADAFRAAESEWRAEHPSRTFDKGAREEILGRVLELMSR